MIEDVHMGDVKVGDVIRDRDLLLIVVAIRHAGFEVHIEGLRYEHRRHRVKVYGRDAAKVRRYPRLGQAAAYPAAMIYPYDLFVYEGVEYHYDSEDALPEFPDDAHVFLILRGYHKPTEYGTKTERDPRGK